MLRRLLAICLTFAVGVPAFAASPAKDAGKPFADDAAQAFKDQRFQEAAELFEKAFALGNDKFVRLRNAGRAWEEAGKLEYARTQFQKFLDKVPSGPEHDEVGQRLAALEQRLAAPAPQPVAAVPVVVPQPAVAVVPGTGVAVPAEPAHRPRWLAWTLGGGGAAAFVGGMAWLALTESAAGRMQTQNQAGRYTAEKLTEDQAVILRNRIGYAVVGGVGLGAAIAGVIALTRTPSATGQLQPLLLGDGAGLAWQGAF